jgi:hypothetical protein
MFSPQVKFEFELISVILSSSISRTNNKKNKTKLSMLEFLSDFITKCEIALIPFSKLSATVTVLEIISQQDMTSEVNQNFICKYTCK